MRSDIKKSIKQILFSYLNWQSKYINHRNFLIILCILIGIIAGFSAVILKRTANFFEHLLSNSLQGSFFQNSFFLFPIIGIVLTVLVVRWLLKGQMQTGVGHIIYSIAKQRSYLDKNNIWSHLLTSALTVSMGGSVGLEAPIVSSGAAIGSTVGKNFRIGYKERTLLLASGAAAGLAAIFNCPITGVIFALEVLLFDFSIPFVIPLIISTATASVVSQIFYPEKFFFLITNKWDFSAIPVYVVMGIGMGLLSVFMIRASLKIEHHFFNFENRWKRVALAGLPLCILIFVFPPLFGEGYVMIENLLQGADYKLGANTFFSQYLSNGWLLLAMAVCITFLKVITASLTLGAGGNGGIFGPSMFTGAMGGFVFARFVNLTGFFHLEESNFIVAGMAGVVAGVIHAPLTGIFLIAEITGGYALFVPLMIVVAISYFVTRSFERFSIYHKRLAQRGITFKNQTGDEDL
jgi:chloride channel protein, CIC family